MQLLSISPLTGKGILGNGTGQFTTLVLNQPSQPEGTTQVCIAEIICIPDTGKNSVKKNKNHTFLHTIRLD